MGGPIRARRYDNAESDHHDSEDELGECQASSLDKKEVGWRKVVRCFLCLLTVFKSAQAILASLIPYMAKRGGGGEGGSPSFPLSDNCFQIRTSNSSQPHSVNGLTQHRFQLPVTHACLPIVHTTLLNLYSQRQLFKCSLTHDGEVLKHNPSPQNKPSLLHITTITSRASLS